MKNLLKKVLEGTKKTASITGMIWDLVSAFALIIIYNPSGYSYFHFMKKYNWDFVNHGVSAMFVILGLVIFITPILLDMPSAWKAAGWKGKVLFAIYLAVVGGFMFVTNHYSVIDIIWLLEFAAIAFMLWGAYVNYRDKKKYSKVGTSIEDSHTTVDVDSDVDDD